MRRHLAAVALVLAASSLVACTTYGDAASTSVPPASQDVKGSPSWREHVAVSSGNSEVRHTMGELLAGNLDVRPVRVPGSHVIVRVLFYPDRSVEYNVQYAGHIVAKMLVHKAIPVCAASAKNTVEAFWFHQGDVQDQFLDFVDNTFRDKLPAS